jgi:hypothetical protein
MVTVTELNRAANITANTIDAGSVSAETLLGADVLNSAENQILVAQGDGTLAVETQAQGPNPYDQAQSFDESDVTVTTTDTDVANGSIELLSSETIDNFEDGDITTLSSLWNGWNGDTGNLTAQQTTVINGSFSGGLDSNSEYATVSSTRSSTTANDYLCSVRIPDKAGTNSDGTTVTIGDFSADNQIGFLLFVDDGGVTWRDDTGDQTVRSSWSVDTTYNLQFIFDFTNETVDIVINGTNEGTFNFRQSASSYQFIEFGNRTTNSGISREIYFDDVEIDINPATSGSAVIEWDRGIPTDIFEWDVATFTRTLDGETVDVYVAYSSDGGSTWTRTNSANPITRNYSLNEDSNITPNLDVRIETELSRTDTANNPTLDSAYRSWLV